MSYKIGILYLTDDRRHHTFDFFCKNLNVAKGKETIKLLVMTNSNDESFYEDTLKGYKITYEIKKVHGENNYLDKLKEGAAYCIENKIPTCLKIDNDILIFPTMFDFLVDNISLLDNDNNFFIQPVMTNGVPTVEQFIKDFLNEEEKSTMYNLFKEYRYSSNIWGLGVDGTCINKWADTITEWDGEGFFDAVRKVDHFYKGIHPIRLSKPALTILNDIIINNRDKIKNQNSIEPQFENTCPYYCCGIYLIKSETLKTVLAMDELFVDPYEEVPLNRYREKKNLNIVTTKNGCVIHMIYNCYDNHHGYERDFMQRLL